MDEALRLIGETTPPCMRSRFRPTSRSSLTARGANETNGTQALTLLRSSPQPAQAMRKNTPKTLAAMTGGEYELFETRNGFETDLTGFANHLDAVIS